MTSHILMNEDLASKFRFLSWLQLRVASIHSLEARCQSATLDKSMSALAHSRSLTTCSLSNFDDTTLSSVDLTPLRGMSALKSLSLQGKFGHLSAPKHLTHLCRCDVINWNWVDCDLCNMLVHLQVRDSNVAHKRVMCMHQIAEPRNTRNRQLAIAPTLIQG